jgi:hypothetical protein
VHTVHIAYHSLIERVCEASFGADVYAAGVDDRRIGASITHTRSFQNPIALGNFAARR